MLTLSVFQEHSVIFGSKIKVDGTRKDSSQQQPTAAPALLQELRRNKASQRSHEGVIGHGLRSSVTSRFSLSQVSCPLSCLNAITSCNHSITTV